MDISKGMKRKITLLKERREHANSLEREIFDYFEEQGIDIGFIDVVGSKITYGEINSIEDVEQCLNEFLNRRIK